MIVRKKVLSLLVIGICLLTINLWTQTFAFNITENSEEGEFSVLTYNIHCSSPDFNSRETDIAHLIGKQKCDIVFLCEYALSHCKKLDSILTHQYGYTLYYKSGTNCAYYSTYECDSIIGVTTPAIKRCLTNRINVSTPKGIVTVIGCHLASSRKNITKAYEQRKIEADSIYNAVNAISTKTIVLGDMNDFSGSYTIRRIQEAGLKDAWWEGGLGYGSTFHSKWMRFRLDHILYNDEKFELKKVKVIDSELSDHNPLTASFVIL